MPETTGRSMITAREGEPTPAIETLIDRSGDLKGELVAFAQSPRFARQLNSRLRDASERHGFLDEATAVSIIDQFALQHRLSDRRTVLERFVAQRRPRLPDDERELVLGWRDVVDRIFEVQRLDENSVRLHNLVDDLVYQVYSNMGAGAFRDLRKGMFVIGRIVPVRPTTDAWLVSGHLALYRRSAGPELATAAAQLLVTNPELLWRNPEKVRQGWEMQAEQRASFIDFFGSDLVVLPPVEAQAKLAEYYRTSQQAAAAKLDRKAARRALASSPSAEALGRLPAELLEADSVAVVYDEVEGLTFYRDFARADALLADPSLAGDRTHLDQLRSYLRDDSVSPLAIRRLVDRHPDGADAVFRVLLRKPGFCWQRDGEDLLRRHKKGFFDTEPTPCVSPVGDRLTELLRGGR